MTKENRNKKQMTVVSNTEEVSKLIKIVVAVLVIFGLFYLVTYFVTKKDKEEEKTPVTIQYKEILVGELLKQSPTSYYVLVAKEKDMSLTLYNQYLSIYSKKDKALTYYLANLDNIFNKKFNGENNTNITTINDLKLNETALFKITDKKIELVFTNKTDIVNHFETLIK